MSDTPTAARTNQPDECDYYGRLWLAFRNQAAASQLIDAYYALDSSRFVRPESATAWSEILDRIRTIHTDVADAVNVAEAAYRAAIIEGKVNP